MYLIVGVAGSTILAKSTCHIYGIGVSTKVKTVHKLFGVVIITV